jgi:hypothetical protein
VDGTASIDSKSLHEEEAIDVAKDQSGQTVLDSIARDVLPGTNHVDTHPSANHFTSSQEISRGQYIADFDAGIPT